MSESLSGRLANIISEIKIENGLAPDNPCMVCLGCRKPVNIDRSNGLMFCECIDERKGIDPDNPNVIPISILEDDD